MAERRKLQADIERCLKKVNEGIEHFEDTWQKVHTASNSTQKGKYEADLKKEIKKLQKLRDQIKTWMSSSEVKEKDVLMKNRKLIEAQMERFRALEHEMKTKAYSKEGLEGVQKVDPAQKEKDDLTAWLSSSIQALGIHMDQFDSELESLTVGQKKKNDRQDRVAELKALLTRHRYHISHLETLLRMLHNGNIEISKISDIKEDVEYYINSCQEPGFEENIFLYDDLDLQDMNKLGMKAVVCSDVEHVTNTTADTAATNGGTGAGADTNESTHSGSPVPTPDLSSNGMLAQRTVVNKEARSVLTSTGEATRVTTSKISAPMGACNKGASLLQGGCNTLPDAYHNRSLAPKSPPVTIHAVAVTANCKDAAIPPVESTVTPIAETPDNWRYFFREPSTTKQNENSSVDTASPPLWHCESGMNEERKAPEYADTTPCGSAATSGDSPSLQEAWSALRSKGALGNKSGGSTSKSKSIAQRKVRNTDLDSHLHPPPAQRQSEQQMPGQLITVQEQPAQQLQVQALCEGGMFESVQGAKKGGQRLPSAATTGAHCSHFTGVAPKRPAPLLSKECRDQLRLLEAASLQLPLLGDCEPPNPCVHQAPVAVPSYYPQGFANWVTSGFMEKVSTECLFYAFYYTEGSRTQYLAAKALKQRSWRFHTKNKTWYFRYEDPEVITDEYEHGTYVYFDFQKWCQRRVDGFTFEYRYLEERELD